MHIFNQEINPKLPVNIFHIKVLRPLLIQKKALYTQADWNGFEIILKEHDRADLLSLLKGYQEVLVQPEPAQLEQAIKVNDLIMVTRLIKRGAKVSQCCLDLAVQKANADILQIVLQSRAAPGLVEERELLDLICLYHSNPEQTALFIRVYKKLLSEKKIKSMEIGRKISSDEKSKLLSSDMSEYFLKNFPHTDIWRFFVDGYKQTSTELNDKNEKGWCGYERREMGCLNTMYNAFEIACLDQSELHATRAFILHKKATNHLVKKITDKFDSTTIYNLIPGRNFSLLGYLELSEKPYNVWNKLGYDLDQKCLWVRKKSSNDITLEQIFYTYNQSQKELASSDRESILKNIILLASQYTRLHPRTDGNNRTAVILLNTELIKYGFIPVILEEPNELEGLSQVELLEKVYQGMLNTCHVIKTGCYPGGKSTIQLKQSIALVYFKNLPDTIAASFEKLKKILIEKQTILIAPKKGAR